jgi:hypothetical protein
MFIESITRRINDFYNSANPRLEVSIPFVPTIKEARAIPARAI